MSRALTSRERDVVAFLILRGQPVFAEPKVTALDRQHLLSQLRSIQAGPQCDCGRCPSVELRDEWGETPQEGDRIILYARAPGAEVTLYVDNLQLSFLELMPLQDIEVRSFPSYRLLTVEAARD